MISCLFLHIFKKVTKGYIILYHSKQTARTKEQGNVQKNFAYDFERMLVSRGH